jgi:hypothetical protein
MTFQPGSLSLEEMLELSTSDYLSMESAKGERGMARASLGQGPGSDGGEV